MYACCNIANIDVRNNQYLLIFFLFRFLCRKLLISDYKNTWICIICSKNRTRNVKLFDRMSFYWISAFHRILWLKWKRFLSAVNAPLFITNSTKVKEDTVPTMCYFLNVIVSMRKEEEEVEIKNGKLIKSASLTLTWIIIKWNAAMKSSILNEECLVIFHTYSYTHTHAHTTTRNLICKERQKLHLLTQILMLESM